MCRKIQQINKSCSSDIDNLTIFTTCGKFLILQEFQAEFWYNNNYEVLNIMQCQICNKKEATIHLTEISEGQRTEMHICELCAAEQGIAVKNQIPLNELLSSLLASQPSDEQLLDPSQKELSCPHCGFTLEQFRNDAVLGCPHDYEVFEKSLAPLIEKAHNGHSIHCGKVPSKTPKNTKKQMELLKLQQQLDTAVQAENYEQAAELRDKINRIEK